MGINNRELQEVTIRTQLHLMSNNTIEKMYQIMNKELDRIADQMSEQVEKQEYR